MNDFIEFVAVIKLGGFDSFDVAKTSERAALIVGDVSIQVDRCHGYDAGSFPVSWCMVALSQQEAQMSSIRPLSGDKTP